MKADWDDAPSYLKKKPANALHIGIAFIAGCVVTSSAFLTHKYLESQKPFSHAQFAPPYQPKRLEVHRVAAPEAHKKAVQAAARKAAEDKKATALAELLGDTVQR